MTTLEALRKLMEAAKEEHAEATDALERAEAIRSSPDRAVARTKALIAQTRNAAMRDAYGEAVRLVELDQASREG